MCGRFTIKAETEQLSAAVRGLAVSDWRGPRYNVAPGQDVPAVRDPSARLLEWLRWGLIPTWAKDAAIGSRLINARAESLGDRPAFRDAYMKRRCVVLADGFFEWGDEGGRKQPFYFHRPDGSPFAIAGLWSPWSTPEGREVLTCALITTEANDTVAAVHNRMPVILVPEAVDAWLDSSGAPPADLLRPCPARDLCAVPVGTQVNRVSFDHPTCIEPLASRPRQLDLGWS